MTSGTLSKRIGELLIKNSLTVSVAESCTGGLIGASLTDCAGSSQYFKGGIIAYDNSVKERILRVPRNILESKGAVSEETVIAMSKGACFLLETECAISVSGIAGPGGGTPQKPAGLVYIGIVVNDYAQSIRNIFTGNRAEIRQKTVYTALSNFVEILESNI
ncbi:MAG TPA: CinA family protein [Chitinispirillaceae bacterium]|nr:CinA family protein [Chitinispirillaceae bacterium]